MKALKVFSISLLFSIILFACNMERQDSSLKRSQFSDLVYLTDGVSARISSWDTTGGNHDFYVIDPGDTLVLADIENAGSIRHIYFSIAPVPGYLRNLVLKMYWDGEESPSVNVPFGDFFGQGHEREKFFRSLMVIVNEGGGGRFGTIGFNAYFPMPFSHGARLELVNEGKDRISNVWYHIDYEKLKKVGQNVGRFHAQWRHESPTTAVGEWKNVVLHDGKNPDGSENYVILDAEGHGNFAGYFLNIDNQQGDWYGEGDDMIFIDGESWPPSYHGTGSEEIFGGGACPNIEYAGPYTGFYMIGNPDWTGKVSMYRFYIADPVRFRKSIHVTIEHGHANNMENYYSTTAFWYQSEPHKPFPPLPDVESRHPRINDTPFDNAHQAHLEYRKAFRSAMALLAEKGVHVPFYLDLEIIKYSMAIEDAFNNRNYDMVIQKCRECINWLEVYKDQYK